MKGLSGNPNLKLCHFCKNASIGCGSNETWVDGCEESLVRFHELSYGGYLTETCSDFNMITVLDYDDLKDKLSYLEYRLKTKF